MFGRKNINYEKEKVKAELEADLLEDRLKKKQAYEKQKQRLASLKSSYANKKSGGGFLDKFGRFSEQFAQGVIKSQSKRKIRTKKRTSMKPLVNNNYLSNMESLIMPTSGNKKKGKKPDDFFGFNF